MVAFSSRVRLSLRRLSVEPSVMRADLARMRASARKSRYTAGRMPEGTLFEQLGGQTALRAIIERFVDRMFDDIMIGYLFRAADRERVKAKEYEFAARHLGAPVAYTGRPIAEAHRAHRITGGQFMRRLQLLKETLAAFQAPPAVSEHWIEHTLSLSAEITDNALDQCDPQHENRKRPLPG